jgi:hypothetical protein
MHHSYWEKCELLIERGRGECGSWVVGWGVGGGLANGRGLFKIRCYTCLVVFVFLLFACRHFLIADLITLLDFFEPDLSAMTANIGPANKQKKRNIV